MIDRATGLSASADRPAHQRQQPDPIGSCSVPSRRTRGLGEARDPNDPALAPPTGRRRWKPPWTPLRRPTTASQSPMPDAGVVELRPSASAPVGPHAMSPATAKTERVNESGRFRNTREGG